MDCVEQISIKKQTFAPLCRYSRNSGDNYIWGKTVLVDVCFSPKTVLVDVNEVRSGIVVTLTWPKLGPALKYELLSSLGQSWVFDAEASCRTLALPGHLVTLRHP